MHAQLTVNSVHFYRPPGHEEAYTQNFEQISARVTELEQIGGSRILMQGGVNPDLKLEWYIDLISKLRNSHPTIVWIKLHQSKLRELLRYAIYPPLKYY